MFLFWVHVLELHIENSKSFSNSIFYSVSAFNVISVICMFHLRIQRIYGYVDKKLLSRDKA